jgi:hypothetical protein
MLQNVDLVIARLPGDAFHFRERQQLNVQMPADLDQFRRNDSHGTVIGREGLIQLGHDPTDGGGPLNQMDKKTGIRQINGRLHPGNPSSCHEYRADFFFSHISLSLSFTLDSFMKVVPPPAAFGPSSGQNTSAVRVPIQPT